MWSQIFLVESYKNTVMTNCFRALKGAKCIPVQKPNVVSSGLCCTSRQDRFSCKIFTKGIASLKKSQNGPCTVPSLYSHANRLQTVLHSGWMLFLDGESLGSVPKNFTLCRLIKVSLTCGITFSKLGISETKISG